MRKWVWVWLVLMGQRPTYASSIDLITRLEEKVSTLWIHWTCPLLNLFDQPAGGTFHLKSCLFLFIDDFIIWLGLIFLIHGVGGHSKFVVSEALSCVGSIRSTGARHHWQSRTSFLRPPMRRWPLEIFCIVAQPSAVGPSARPLPVRSFYVVWE